VSMLNSKRFPCINGRALRQTLMHTPVPGDPTTTFWESGGPRSIWRHVTVGGRCQSTEQAIRNASKLHCGLLTYGQPMFSPMCRPQIISNLESHGLRECLFTLAGPRHGSACEPKLAHLASRPACQGSGGFETMGGS